MFRYLVIYCTEEKETVVNSFEAERADLTIDPYGDDVPIALGGREYIILADDYEIPTPNVSLEDIDAHSRIANRARELGVKFEHLTLMMDLSYVNDQIDLEKLEKFPNGDFLHDVSGILTHMDRQTGQLVDCFLPRCAKR